MRTRFVYLDGELIHEIVALTRLRDQGSSGKLARPNPPLPPAMATPCAKAAAEAAKDYAYARARTIPNAH